KRRSGRLLSRPMTLRSNTGHSRHFAGGAAHLLDYWGRNLALTPPTPDGRSALHPRVQSHQRRLRLAASRGSWRTPPPLLWLLTTFGRDARRPISALPHMAPSARDLCAFATQQRDCLRSDAPVGT